MSLRRVTTYPYHSLVREPVKFSLKIASLLLLLASSSVVASAQDGASLPFNPAVYRIGERLTYNVDFSKFVSAAHVEMMISGRGNFHGRDGIELKGHVETTGVVNVAVVSMNKDYTTYVAADTGLPYRVEQVVREAGRTSEAAVDYNQPAGVEAITSRTRMGEFAGTFDLLSAIYRVRALPLGPGARYYLNVRYENEEIQADIKVIGKEMVRTNLGSFDAVVTRVSLKDRSDYSLRIYFTDDEWHVPVLLTARGDSADIHVELAGSELIPPVPNKARSTTVVPANTLPTPTPTRPPITLPPGTQPTSPATNPQVETGQPAAPTRLDLPFNIGEVLNYQVYLGNAKQPVGSMTFTVKGRTRFGNRDGLQLVYTAQTVSGAIFLVRDRITSYVDPETLLPFRTEIDFQEGRWRFVRNYDVDQERGGASTEGARTRIEIPVGTHDLLSAFYAARIFDLSVKKQNAVSLLAGNGPRALIIRSERRETLDLGGQKIPAIMLSLTTDDPQPDKLQIRIWVGDDSRRLPLRITAATDLGAVRADLAIQAVGPR